ncbi:hypothetical protein PM082_002115 [Marasmius tenuissimus]|nr:hypothetical protein PM082_002115 [Marasmius tenuissimus]
MVHSTSKSYQSSEDKNERLKFGKETPGKFTTSAFRLSPQHSCSATRNSSSSVSSIIHAISYRGAHRCRCMAHPLHQLTTHLAFINQDSLARQRRLFDIGLWNTSADNATSDTSLPSSLKIVEIKKLSSIGRIWDGIGSNKDWVFWVAARRSTALEMYSHLYHVHVGNRIFIPSSSCHIMDPSCYLFFFLANLIPQQSGTLVETNLASLGSLSRDFLPILRDL